MSSAALIFALSVGAGYLGAMLGLGGGMFLVPLLTLFLGLPIHTVVATSLLAVIVTSLSASTTYCRSDHTNVRLAFLLEAVTVVGAVVGGFIATRMSAGGLKVIFGVVALITAYAMVRRRNEPAELSAPETGNFDRLSKYWNVTGSCRPCEEAEPQMYQVRNLPGGLIVGFVAGNISALLGIGGGVFKVPTMNLVMNVPFKSAVATSTFMVGMTASVTALIYYVNGFVNVRIATPAVFGVLIGAQLGALTAKKANPASLRKLLSLVLAALAVQMIAAAF